MRQAPGLLLLSLLAAALVGCASARLTLNLDLYAEDPRTSVLQLTPARIGEIDATLQALAREVGPLATDRQAIADDMFGVFEAVNRALFRIQENAEPPKGDPSVEEARGYLARHKKRLSDMAAEAIEKIKQAQGALDGYARLAGTQPPAGGDGMSPVTAELGALKAINEAASAVARLGGPLDTEFERLLIAQWPIVAQSVTEENVVRLRTAEGSDTAELKALRQRVSNLADRLRLLHERGRRVPESTIAALDAAFKETRPTPGRLKASFDGLVLAATEVSAALAPPDRLEALVRATGRVANLVDRLQDPGDPVWRIVSQPENEAKWRKTFAETYFFAEGNTSVVVVRDTPFSFRVMKAANNPTALVQGQLQVSRAIANAAIAVAGAASGVPVPKLPGTSGSASAPGGQEAVDIEQFARRKATIERQAAARAEAIRALRRQLVALRSQVERAPDNQTAVNEVLERVRALLAAYDTLLTPVAP